MNIKSSPLAVCAIAILITLLFYKQGIGLNLLLFDILFFAGLIFTKQFSIRNRTQLITGLGFMLTSLFTVVSYTIYGYVIHFLALFLFVGTLNYAKSRSLITSLGIATVGLFTSQIEFVKQIIESQIQGKRAGRVLWKSRIFVAPVLIIFVFIGIYSFSNAKFGSIMGSIGIWIQNTINFVFSTVDFALVFTFILALIIGAFLWMRTSDKGIENTDRTASEILTRKPRRVKRDFKLKALVNEYKSGVFLLIALNLLLLLLNSLDVYWVWFNFEWDGQTLKEYVHEGTYFLIFSILISIAVVLYFFRGNLNFYKKNKVLTILSYTWLIQNAVLAISVGIRNFRYIEHFSLAYKRIGVVLFLALTLYGLYTVFVKIQHKKSAFYLFKTNALAIYIMLLVSSFINWDSTIAQYNFAHSDSSYVHLDYLSRLSDKSLYALDISENQLKEIDQYQKAKFLHEKNELTYSDYYSKIQRRKASFKEKWESKNWLSWNLAEYNTYQKLYKR